MKHTALGYWIEEAGEPDPLPPLEGDREADVVVVGGGYAGMWAAWHVLEAEPEARVVVLEADRAGRGPSGRNGGFCNAMWFSLPAMRRRFGDGPALEVARSAQSAVDEVERFCAAEGVDAWFRRGGYLQVSTSPGQDGAWAETVAACRELGEPASVEPLSAEQVAARCRSPAFRGGALYPGTATVQPARLAFGLLERLRHRGAAVHESSPVRRLRSRSGAVEARTPAGRVRAGAAVLAVGASAARLRWPHRLHLTVTSSHIALTEPVPDVLEQVGWTGGECITDSRALLHYFRTTPDGRICFGWGGGRVALGGRIGGRAEIDGDVIGQVARDLRSIFPALEGRAITHAWGGPIDASPAHLPVIHTRAEGRIAAVFGFTGNGVGPSKMVARSLASLALDRRDEASRLALIDPSPHRVPPEPFRWLGGTAIRVALDRAERAEQAGRRPGRLARAVAAIPERIGFHIGR